MKRREALFGGVWGGLVLFGCRRGAPRTAGEEHVAVAGGAITEIAFELGCGSRIVGTDTSSIFPAAASALPKFGYQRQLAGEGILALGPKLFLASDEAGQSEVLEQLRSAGVRVEIVATPKSAEAIGERVVRVGEALGVASLAATLSQRINDDIQRLSALAQARKARPRVLFLYARGRGTMMVGGRNTSASVVLSLAGCENAANGLEGFLPLTPEAVIDAQPEIVLVPELGLQSLGGKEGLLATPGMAETPMAKNGRVVAVDDLLLLGLGPRVTQAIDTVVQQVFG